MTTNAIVTPADIARLTPAQQRVLGEIAVNQDGGHPPTTLRALERRGFIEPHDEYLPSGLAGIPLRR